MCMTGIYTAREGPESRAGYGWRRRAASRVAAAHGASATGGKGKRPAR